MLQIAVRKTIEYYKARNRWWIPLVTGLLYPLCLPPFNHETNPLFAPFPLLSFVVLIPLFGFAIQRPLRRALLHTYLFAFTASLGQYYWVGFVTAEGLWHLILMGLVLMSAVVGVFYLVAAMLFRLAFRVFPRYYVFLFPALWVLVDYSRTLGEISFPWALLGYSLTPLLPLVQTASVWGVWGITFVVVLGNVVLWEVLRSHYYGVDQYQKWIHAGVFAIFIVAIGVMGWSRMRGVADPSKDVRLSLLQNNIDQFHWDNSSLDKSFDVAGELLNEAARSDPDLMIMPESALLCYLVRRPALKDRVDGWALEFNVPIVLGGLHWDKAPEKSPYEYLVYNTAFLADPRSRAFQHYHKIKLVPFSEALPFEGVVPLLSRINLGEADFQRGRDFTIFDIGRGIRGAPFICYEIIYPGFVRERIRRGANLIVNITNDGWFGKTTGPHHHATMARMRCVENGVAMARCANSGISMFVDRYGRVKGRTSLYTRTTLSGAVSLDVVPTFYTRYGDWFVLFCGLVALCGAIAAPVNHLLVRRNENRPTQRLPIGLHTEEPVDSARD